MKLKIKIYTFVILVILIGPVGCSSDDSSPGGRAANGRFSIAESKGVYTEAASAGSPFGFDPYMFGEFDTSLGGTEIWLYDAHSPGAGDCCWSEVFNMAFEASVPGNYSTSNDTFFAVWGVPSGIFVSAFGIAGGDGNITVDSMESVGGRIQGSFGINACKSPDGSAIPVDCSAGMMVLSGTFDVTREADGTAGPGKGLDAGLAEQMRLLLVQ